MEASPSSDSAPAELLRRRLVARDREHMLVAAAAATGRGLDEFLDPALTGLLGFFLAEGDAVSSLYLVSDRLFATCQASDDGMLLQVSVPLDRLRRVAAVSDAAGMRLTVEIDADRSSATTRVLESGESYSVQVPAGYEMVAAGADEVEMLRMFHFALARAL